MSSLGPNFLPVIVERFARERLWAVAQSQGRVETLVPSENLIDIHRPIGGQR